MLARHPPSLTLPEGKGKASSCRVTTLTLIDIEIQRDQEIICTIPLIIALITGDLAPSAMTLYVHFTPWEFLATQQC